MMFGFYMGLPHNYVYQCKLIALRWRSENAYEFTYEYTYQDCEYISTD